MAALAMGAACDAQAHTVMRGAGDFYAGALHPLTSIEDVLPIVMLGLLAGQNGLKRCQFTLWLLPLAFALGACVALQWPMLRGAFVVNLGSAVILGALLAAAWRLPSWVIFALALGFGITHGYANGVEIVGAIRPPIFIGGMMAAVFIVTGYTVALADWMQRLPVGWARIAIRVAGSWSVAIAMLAISVAPRAILLS